MNLQSLWPWRRPAPLCRPQLAALPELLVDVDEADETSPAGCGWFDSSHELRRGLLVTEHASADAVAADLPLDGWLDLHLAGWQPSVGGLQ